MAVSTHFKEGDTVRFTNAGDPTDPNNGQHVVVTAINPAPLLFPGQEHYRIFVPSLLNETYALASELTPKQL